MNLGPANAIEEATQFVATIFEPDDIVELRLCRGKGATPQRWAPAAAFDKQIGWLTAQNSNGFNCYAGINPRRAKGTWGINKDKCTTERSCGGCASCVVLARCLFADFDNTAEVEVVRRQIDQAAMPQPSILVHSGHGFHVYWRLDDPITDLGVWSRYQRAIIARLGTDPVVHDAPRIMRVPGFLNVKREPHVPCALIECDGAATFPLSDFPEPAPPPAPLLQSDGSRAIIDDATLMSERLRRCKSYLAKLPPAIQGEHGSDRFFDACCEVFRFGLDDAEARAVAAWFSTNHSVPPWSDGEIEHKLANAKAKVVEAGELGVRLRDHSQSEDLGQAAGTLEVTLSEEPAPAQRRLLLRRPFPIGALPRPMSAFASAAALGMDCDAAMLAVPMLAIAASLIGTARWLRLNPTWKEPAILWVATFAPSGSMKTPAVDLVARPLHELESGIYKRYLADMETYQHELAEYTRQMTAFARGKARDGGSRPQKPVEPKIVALTATDYTIEALADRLEANRKGVLLLHDELAGFFGGMDKYRGGRGGDESKLLSLWSGGAFRVDRAGGRKRLYLPMAGISVYGGIQPMMAARLLTPERFGSGMAGRFLWSAPADTPIRFRNTPIGNIEWQGWYGIVQALHELTHVQRDGDLLAVEVGFTYEAERAFSAWHNRIEQRRCTESDARLAAALAKMRGYLGRIALVLHMVKAVCGETADAMRIGADTVEAAANLTQWFATNAEFVYATILDAEAQGIDEKYVGIVKRLGGAATPRELKNACRSVKDVNEAERILRALAEIGRGTFRPEKSPRGGPAALRFRLAHGRAPVCGADATPVYGTPENAEENRGSGYVDIHSTVVATEIAPPSSENGISTSKDLNHSIDSSGIAPAQKCSGVYVSESASVLEENGGSVDGGCGEPEYPPDDVLDYWHANGQGSST